MKNKLEMITLKLSSTDNPVQWTETILSALLNGKVIVGYILKTPSCPTFNWYVIDKKYVTENDIISLETLRVSYLQWLDSLNEDTHSFMFRNPPLELWLESKNNWVKKMAYKLSQSYSKDYDECVSTLYMTILRCYNRQDVYIGNLNYLSTAAHNDIKLEHRFNENRWSGEHPDAVYLDVAIDQSGGENGFTLHEVVVGVEDQCYEDERIQFVVDEIMADLREDFSDREIDQIINTPGYLPMSIYRRLLKWRKDRKLEDYL